MRPESPNRAHQDGSALQLDLGPPTRPNGEVEHLSSKIENDNVDRGRMVEIHAV